MMMQLDRLIGYCVDVDKMDIASFKGLVKEYNAGLLSLPEPAGKETMATAGGQSCRDDDPALTRDCSYYEANAIVGVRG